MSFSETGILTNVGFAFIRRLTVRYDFAAKTTIWTGFTHREFTRSQSDVLVSLWILFDLNLSVHSILQDVFFLMLGVYSSSLTLIDRDYRGRMRSPEIIFFALYS